MKDKWVILFENTENSQYLQNSVCWHLFWAWFDWLIILLTF